MLGYHNVKCSWISDMLYTSVGALEFLIAKLRRGMVSWEGGLSVYPSFLHFTSITTCIPFSQM
jgi:hypothetical protein